MNRLIEWLTYNSKSIAGFPMGDNPQRKFPVYLPPNYSKTAKPYPTIFVLAGWGSRAAKYLGEDSVFNRPLEDRLDDLIVRNELPPFVGVFVDGASKLGCSQYVNSAAIGNYSDYICDELTSFIDSQFNTAKSADFRGIMGHSSGGYGALYNAAYRPDRFKFLCSSAGDSLFEISILPHLVSSMEILEKEGSPESFINNYLQQPNPGGSGHKKYLTMMTLSLAACYAPNPKVPGVFGDLFFDTRTGKLIDKIWQKYLEFDPVRFIPKLSQNIRQLKYALLECGMSDEYGARWGHRQIAEEFEKAKLSHDLVEYTGGHSGHNWRFELRAKTLLEKMDALK